MWIRLTKKVQHFNKLMQQACWQHSNFLCTSDSPRHFLIMVWFPESFPSGGFSLPASSKREIVIKHAITNLRGKNNIDWKPRGLWITYCGRFISAASSWHLPACCPVCAKKIMAFLTIWKKLLFCITVTTSFLSNTRLALLFQLLNCSHKCYWTNNKIFIHFISPISQS